MSKLVVAHMSAVNMSVSACSSPGETASSDLHRCRLEWFQNRFQFGNLLIPFTACSVSRVFNLALAIQVLLRFLAVQALLHFLA